MALALAGVLTAALERVGWASSNMRLGFNDAWRHEHKADLFNLGAAFAYVGATVIRYPWVWDVETDQELFDGIKEARDANLKPILCPYSYSNDANQIDKYTDMLTEVGDRWGGAAIEVLNEPNLDNYGDYSAQEYAAFFRQAHAAISAVGNPDRKILASGGAWSPLQQDSFWLRDFANATADLDYAVSAHFYTGQQTQFTPEQAVQNLLALYRKQFPGREIWCTEVGYPSGTLGQIQSSESEQAAMLGAMVDELVRQGIPRICVHRLYDMSATDTVRWGIRRANGTWKPVADRLIADAL